MGKIKIYKAFHTYQSYLDVFYKRNNHLKKASFQDQRAALIHDGFPWIFSWSENNSCEDIEIFETVHNCEHLQKAWSNKYKNENDWQLQIVYEQIKEQQPNICVLYPPDLFEYDKLEHIRSLVNHEIIFVGYDGMDRQDVTLYNGYDLILTCSDYISNFYKSCGKLTYTLNFCFDESILLKINTLSQPKYSIGFTGSIYQNVHDNRYNLLKKLSKEIDVAIRSDFGIDVNYSLFSKNQIKRLVKEKDIENYLGLWRISKNNPGPVYGLDMFQFLRDSKVSINMHGDKIGFAANVRMYEITGVGSCMLTDWKENIGELFEPGKEIVTYTCLEEACEKSRFLIKNEKIRLQIAKAGQERTLKEYTYKKTILKLLFFLKGMLN